MLLLVSAVMTFQLHHVAVPLKPFSAPVCDHRADARTAIDMNGGNDDGTSKSKDVKVTIRKRIDKEPPVAHSWPVFVAKFSHVKKSLGTFLKFWLMGGCGAEGWAGIGELEAKHSSGTLASIEVDVEQATVTLISKSEPSFNSSIQLSRYAAALLSELKTLASTEEAEAADRLCYPPEAVDMATDALTLEPPSS